VDFSPCATQNADESIDSARLCDKAGRQISRQNGVARINQRFHKYTGALCRLQAAVSSRMAEKDKNRQKILTNTSYAREVFI
jgi:hypothetical protein